MNITFAQKIGIISGGVSIVLVGAYVYGQTVSRPEVSRERVFVEDSSSIIGESRDVGEIVSMDEVVQESQERYSIPSSNPAPSQETDSQKKEALQPLAEEYNIPITEISNFSRVTYPFQQSVNRILPNLEAVESTNGEERIQYRYNPHLNGSSSNSQFSTETYRFSLQDDVVTLDDLNIEGLNRADLEDAMTEITSVVVGNLQRSDVSIQRLLANPNLSNSILADIPSVEGGDIPAITVQRLGLDRLDFLDDLDPDLVKSVALIGDIYPELLQYTRDPTEALNSVALDYLSPELPIQDVLEQLSFEQLLDRLKNDTFSNMMAAFVVQIPLFDFAPCGEKLLPNSPRRYSSAIPTCSLCKRYCATRIPGFFSSTYIYHSYLFGRGRCGCDPRPSASGLPL